MFEAQMLAEVLLQRREAVERHAVPEPSLAPRAEEPLALHARDRAVRCPVVPELGTRGADRADRSMATSGHVLRMPQYARVRPRVDQQAAWSEDPMDLVEGIDHAPQCDASERPATDDDVERAILVRQRLRRADLETCVAHPLVARALPRGSDALGVGVKPLDGPREGRDAEREATVATAEIENALAAHEPRATPDSELVLCARAERKRERRDVFADVASRTAHVRRAASRRP